MPQRIKAIWSDHPQHLEVELEDFLKKVNYDPRKDKIHFTQSQSEDNETLNVNYTAWIEYSVEEEVEPTSEADIEASIKAGLEKFFGKERGLKR